jgi:hypothetical protein
LPSVACAPALPKAETKKARANPGLRHRVVSAS